MISGLVQGISPEIEVQEFWDSEEALEWCIAHGPTLVMLDYRMPAIDGVTFTQRLKGSPAGARTAVVMVTAHDDASIRQAALEAGVVAHVRKPVTPPELKLQIRNLLVAMHGQRVAEAKVDGGAEGPSQLKALLHLVELARQSHPWMRYDVVSPKDAAVAIATQLGLSQSLVSQAATAGDFYSIGLLGVPVSVLQSKAPLSIEDRESIQAADQHSYAILDHVDPDVAQILRHSHECFNGSGHPHGLLGQNIPLLSRIMAVAGSFAAMTSARPHHEASSVAEAIAQLQRQSGSLYDPGCVNALIEALPSLVKASPFPAREYTGMAGGVR